MTMTAYPATPKQVAFLIKLVNENPERKSVVDAELAATGSTHPSQFTKKTASRIIDQILPMKPQRRVETPEPEAGVYRTPEGTLLRVYLGQQSGRMLVQEIVSEAFDGSVSSVRYEYLGSAARVLPAGSRRLSQAEVGELGKAWDHCLVCGRRLDVPESVDRGIGPVCAAKYGA